MKKKIFDIIAAARTGDKTVNDATNELLNLFSDIKKQFEKLENLKPKKRTLTQNRYLHLIISLLAIETGYNLDEAKILLKRECNFMIYEKNGNKFLKRSRDLDTKELTDWIEWIRNYAGTNGIYLPTPDDYQRNWAEIEKEIERHKRYL